MDSASWKVLTLEAGALLSFCYEAEEAGRAFERGAMEDIVAAVSEPKRRKDGRGRPWASKRACLEGILWVLRTGARWRDLPSEYPNGSTCWRRLRMWEESAFWLAAWQNLLSMLDQRRLLDWQKAFRDATFIAAKKGAPGLAKRVGKGTTCMVVVDGRGVPVGAQLASAQIAECRLAESTLKQVRIPRPGRGRPRSHLRRVIADRGYDSDPLRMRLKRPGTELIAPYRKNVRNRNVSRTNESCADTASSGKSNEPMPWLQNFRRIQIRYDRILTVFHGFFHFACLLITLRLLCN